MPTLRELIGKVKMADTVAEGTPSPGRVSLLRDFWCYNRRPTGAERMSLRWQLRLIDQKHIHLNLISVGDDLSSALHRGEINGAAHHLREIFGKVDLGVVRLKHFAISTEQANGRATIDSDSEADDLTNEWTVHNEGVDVFLVRHGWEDEEATRAGLSTVDGSCDKDGGKGMTGPVVSLEGDAQDVGHTMAHEVGHYLGLWHRPDKEAEELTSADVPHARNLMFPVPVWVDGQLDDDQVEIIKSHCFVFRGD